MQYGVSHINNAHMNKKQFLRSLNDVSIRLGGSPHGVGVFAIRAIPKGVNPLKNCDPWGDVLTITKKELTDADAPDDVVLNTSKIPKAVPKAAFGTRFLKAAFGILLS
ncbi:MAG: hypothetical protein A3D65_00275 [Candidatus Lloydbacteria bacterium RIFCSPHIGHO2_02_FULL_50_13]|uniref:Uncharacterized protein n=1 Tax=Candidatus Lloydbacteria bacterium RIFCSPHIGHO2_02_FULL_50_13 TaxID=1798661 RepID=A0A1G2D949_9BACT|nr:MAG: hypothetical protein A3D65_00275 [Candidatus Lloydbacteria bacterium RIFCSPHIGHO2_02_FULL_50_13]